MRYGTLTARICQTAVMVAAFCGVARAQVAIPEFQWQAVSESLAASTNPLTAGQLVDWLNAVQPPMGVVPTKVPIFASQMLGHGSGFSLRSLFVEGP